MTTTGRPAIPSGLRGRGLLLAAATGTAGCGLFLIGDGIAVPVWWAYATSLLLIPAGFHFGSSSAPSARPAG
jgi:hypothetical protein